jgi:hypothetical protein
LSTKSARSEEDNLAPLGVGATNVIERLAASMGELQSVAPQFHSIIDVPYGGVLLALPALLACGLLSEVDEHFKLPKGYYSLQSIFLLLAIMALARIKTPEDLRYCAPGEWGKLLGLDRIPEVRTLREKLKVLSQDGAPEKWGSHLCKQWIEAETEATGMFYIDGHVRVYHGSQTKLPRHYVSREKLCLRATVDYWVNSMGGQPFFYVNKAIDPGLIQVLEHEIVPELEKTIPLLTEEEQKRNPLAHRFTLVVDREGYSPDLMSRMKTKQIACITYHKYPKDDWEQHEFTPQIIRTVAGNLIEVQLAERGTKLSKTLWVREIRRLSDSGHQTSILSTDYSSVFNDIALHMSERWCQENFFKYMRQHYNLDRLIDYSLEAIPDTTLLTNPEYRRIDGVVRRLSAKHSRKLVEFGSIHLENNIEPAEVEAYEQKRAKLLESIQHLQVELDAAKKQRKEIERHITISQLPEEERFRRLATPRKHLIDTIKMVAYRAETAMVNVLRTGMSRVDDGRSLLRAIYQTEADFIPDEKNKTLTVRLHHLANHASDKALQSLLMELNETNTIFPGTELRLIYTLGRGINP